MFYRICVKLVRFFMFFCFRIKTIGKSNIPKEGGVILAVNHKSNLDPVMIGITSPRQLSFMAKAELFENRIFGGLIKKLGAFPIHRGAGDVAALKTAFKILDSDGTMLIFPEGRRVKHGEKRRAKTGVAMIAHKKCVPVVPVLIDGDYKWMGKITIIYGTPISFDEYRNVKLSAEEIQELADGVLNKIYCLGQGEK